MDFCVLCPIGSQFFLQMCKLIRYYFFVAFFVGQKPLKILQNYLKIRLILPNTHCLFKIIYQTISASFPNKYEMNIFKITIYVLRLTVDTIIKELKI